MVYNTLGVPHYTFDDHLLLFQAYSQKVQLTRKKCNLFANSPAYSYGQPRDRASKPTYKVDASSSPADDR